MTPAAPRIVFHGANAASFQHGFAAELGVPAASLRPDADLRAIEGMDSVKVLRMVARIEQAYDIELDDE